MNSQRDWSSLSHEQQLDYMEAREAQSQFDCEQEAKTQMKTTSKKGWAPGGKVVIAIDFDNVIHQYDEGWKGGELYGRPIAGAIEALNKLRTRVDEVYILTARAIDEQSADAVRDWLDTAGVKYAHGLEISNVKKPATVYIDDRAIRFTNWKDIMRYWT